jgi:hypothetical protein
MRVTIISLPCLIMHHRMLLHAINNLAPYRICYLHWVCWDINFETHDIIRYCLSVVAPQS